MNKSKTNYTINGCNGGGIKVMHCSFIPKVDAKKDARAINDFLKCSIPFETRKELIKLIIHESLAKITIEN